MHELHITCSLVFFWWLAAQVCDMDRVVDICDRHDLVLVEDCAHACGVKWRGRQLGYHGKARMPFYSIDRLPTTWPS